MRNPKYLLFTLLLFLVAAARRARAQTTSPNAAEDLGGTSWQLVKFEGGHGTTLTPDDKSKYTVTFEGDGRFNATASLENTYWKATRLGEARMHIASQRQEPYFVLNSESRRVNASGGCNRLMGNYELNSDQITLDGRHDDGLSRRHGDGEGVPGCAEASEQVEDHGTTTRVV